MVVEEKKMSLQEPAYVSRNLSRILAQSKDAEWEYETICSSFRGSTTDSTKKAADSWHNSEFEPAVVSWPPPSNPNVHWTANYLSERLAETQKRRDDIDEELRAIQNKKKSLNAELITINDEINEIFKNLQNTNRSQQMISVSKEVVDQLNLYYPGFEFTFLRPQDEFENYWHTFRVSCMIAAPHVDSRAHFRTCLKSCLTLNEDKSSIVEWTVCIEYFPSPISLGKKQPWLRVPLFTILPLPTSEVALTVQHTLSGFEWLRAIFFISDHDTVHPIMDAFMRYSLAAAHPLELDNLRGEAFQLWPLDVQATFRQWDDFSRILPKEMMQLILAYIGTGEESKLFWLENGLIVDTHRPHGFAVSRYLSTSIAANANRLNELRTTHPLQFKLVQNVSLFVGCFLCGFFSFCPSYASGSHSL